MPAASAISSAVSPARIRAWISLGRNGLSTSISYWASREVWPIATARSRSSIGRIKRPLRPAAAPPYVSLPAHGYTLRSRVFRSARQKKSTPPGMSLDHGHIYPVRTRERGYFDGNAQVCLGDPVSVGESVVVPAGPA